jgi:hypothetical protein
VVDIVDQGRRLEGLAGLLLGQALRRQLAKLVVDQGQELFSGARVALLDRGQDARDLAHRRLGAKGEGILGRSLDLESGKRKPIEPDHGMKDGFVDINTAATCTISKRMLLGAPALSGARRRSNGGPS